MNSLFVNISSQHCHLCLILLYLSIISLSYWRSKYDEMHLRLSHQQQLALLNNSQGWVLGRGRGGGGGGGGGGGQLET